MEKETTQIEVNGVEYLVDLAVEDAGLTATCPELPQLMVAGMERDEVLANIREAIAVHDGPAAAVLKGTL